MLATKPLLTNDGEIKPVYNASDFTFWNAYVTISMLLDYANLYSSNIFRSQNYFTKGIIVLEYINDVSEATFDFLKNVTSDIQDQFNSIYYKLTNITYNGINNTTEILGNLIGGSSWFNSTTSNTMNGNIFKTNKLSANHISTQVLKTNQLICPNIPMIYFFNSNVIYPVLKSGIDKTLTLYVSLAPNYQVIFYNINKVPTASVKNTTNDYMYYVPVDIKNIISFEIFIL